MSRLPTSDTCFRFFVYFSIGAGLAMCLAVILSELGWINLG